MAPDLLLTLAVLAVTVVLLLSNRLRPDLVALLAVLLLGTTGVLTSQETFSGFSRSAVITLLAIFILAEGLERTGVTAWVGEWIARAGGQREGRLVAVSMLAGAALSLVMNNIASAAVLLPGVSAAARRSRVSPSRVLMPLAFGTLLGGMATLLTTTNIVASSLLRDQGLDGFRLLDFAPMGLPLVALGVLYMVAVGRRRLPAHPPAGERLPSPPPAADLVDFYDLGRRLFRARVPAGSQLVDRPLSESTLREIYDLNVVAVERGGQVIQSPPPAQVLAEGDVLYFQGDLDQFRRRDVEPYLEILPPRRWREEDLESQQAVIAEAVVAPRSGLVGKTLRQVHFRSKYGMNVLAVWRGGPPMVDDVSDLSLRFGDALLLQGPRRSLGVLRTEPDLLVLAPEGAEAAEPSARRWVAVAIAAVTLAVAAAGPLPVGEVMLSGALAMVLAKVLTMDQAYRAVEWPTLFLVAGMLPLGIAMSKSGAAALLARGLLGLVGSAGPVLLLAALVLVTVLLVQVLNGPAVAAIMVPIAITAAEQTGADPRSLVMGVALATSMAFATPLGHPVNLLVMGSGGYRFQDYWRVGWPLLLLVMAAVVGLLPLVWPLGPG